MKTFWRKEPLSEKEVLLLFELRRAHFVCAFRNNASSEVFRITADATVDLFRSMSAALSTLGVNHAPIEQIYDFLVNTPAELPKICIGWGSSFIKEQDDPEFKGTIKLLYELNPTLVRHIYGITKKLHDSGKKVYPNPGCWTAATAITLGMTKEISPYLIISPRIEAWATIFYQLQVTSASE